MSRPENEANAGDIHQEQFLRNHAGSDEAQPRGLAPSTPRVSRSESEAGSSRPSSDFGGRVSDYGHDAWNQKSKEPSDSRSVIDLEGSIGPEHLASTPQEESLDEILEGAMTFTRPNDTVTFLPLGKLATICQRDIIYRQFEKMPKRHQPPDLNRYTNYVCGSQNGHASLKIFATLTIIGQLDKIEEFVQAGITDQSLPLRKIQGQSEDGNFRLAIGGRPSTKASEPITFFDGWGQVPKRKFYETQWRLLSPYFSKASDGSVSIYELDEQAILPWIEIKEEKMSSFIPSQNSGGFSKVTRVAIHPDHHTFESETFAIKELIEFDYEPFSKEFKALKRVKDKKHLLPVYAAFRQGKRYSFIFPWADGGSLHDLWARSPLDLMSKVTVGEGEDADGDAYRIRKIITWVASQVAGMTGDLGLGFLHRSNKFLELEQNTLDIFEIEEKYGIHRDIKPENILYFSQLENGDENGLGVLKISDFGVTGFHSTMSRSRQPPTGPFSPTYRAPEYGESKASISRKYDIWGLGCVLLQFLTWLIEGKEGLDAFEISRRVRGDGSGANFIQDTFFQPNKTEGPKPKESVQSHIANLKNTVKTGHYLHDCLNLIETEMLQIDDKKRATCTQLHELFARYHLKCLKDATYADGTLPAFNKPTSNPMFPTPIIILSRDPRQTPSEAASSGTNTNRMSSISASPAASGVSRDNAPHTQDEEIEGSSHVSILQQDEYSGQINNTEVRNIGRSKTKRMLSYIPFCRPVLGFRRRLKHSQPSG